MAMAYGFDLIRGLPNKDGSYGWLNSGSWFGATGLRSAGLVSVVVTRVEVGKKHVLHAVRP